MNNSPSNSLHLFSPLLQQIPSPFLSPFPHLRKISFDISDLISFKLDQEPNYQNYPPFQSLQLTPSNNTPQNVSSNQVAAKQDRIEAISSTHSQRCDMPSTHLQQHKQQRQTPSFLLKLHEAQPTIQNMIEFLVQHSQLPEDLLYLQAKHFKDVGIGAEEIFKSLVTKFRRLKKTKQELTKYCMRKAFKYVSDQGKKDGSGRGLEGSMRRYFAKQDDAQSFCVPFKKDSAQKTMNGNFLRRVFSCPRFAADYRSFLGQFESLIKQDNYPQSNRPQKITILGRFREQGDYLGPLKFYRKPNSWRLHCLKKAMAAEPSVAIDQI